MKLRSDYFYNKNRIALTMQLRISKTNLLRITSIVFFLCLIVQVMAQPLYSIKYTFPEQPLDAFLWVWEDSTKQVQAASILVDSLDVRYVFKPYREIYPAASSREHLLGQAIYPKWYRSA